MFTVRTRLAVAVAATAALTLAGCGDDNASPSASSSAAATSSTQVRTDFVDADVTFLQMMYPHHAQAVEMARLVPSRTGNERLRALAAAIEQAQAPEMQQISGLLQSFGKAAPTTGSQMPAMTSMPSMPGMHGTHDMPETHGMPGMMSGQQMSALQAASGAEFDRLWLTMMIDHHAGAVAMSESELSNGKNADAQALARTIIAAQQAEIAQMRDMLGQR